MCISRNNGIARPLKQEQRKSTQMKDSILYKVTKRELFINKCQHLFVFPTFNISIQISLCTDKSIFETLQH